MSETVGQNPAPITPPPNYLVGDASAEANIQTGKAAGAHKVGALTTDTVTIADQNSGKNVDSAAQPNHAPGEPKAPPPSVNAPFVVPQGGDGGGNPFFSVNFQAAFLQAELTFMIAQKDQLRTMAEFSTTQLKMSKDQVQSEVKEIKTQGEIEAKKETTNAVLSGTMAGISAGQTAYNVKMTYTINRDLSKHQNDVEKPAMEKEQEKLLGQSANLEGKIAKNQAKINGEKKFLNDLQNNPGQLESNFQKSTQKKALKAEDQAKDAEFAVTSGANKDTKTKMTKEEREEAQFNDLQNKYNEKRASGLSEQDARSELETQVKANIQKHESRLEKYTGENNKLQSELKAGEAKFKSDVLTRAKTVSEIKQGTTSFVLTQGGKESLEAIFNAGKDANNAQAAVSSADARANETEARYYEQMFMKCFDNRLSDQNAIQEFIQSMVQALEKVSSQTASFGKG